MAIAIATAVGVVVVVVLGMTRRASISGAAVLTAVYGAATVASLIFLEVDVIPGGSIAGGLLALTAMSLLDVLIRVTTARRRRDHADPREAAASQ